MDIIDFFKAQVTKWNYEKKCGFCWEFDAPLRISDTNESEIQNEGECCVRVLITNLSIRDDISYAGTGYMNDYAEVYSFDLNVVIPSQIDTNVYNEQFEHPISESKWATILQPLRECLKDIGFLEFCDIIGQDRRILSRSWITRIDWLDNNYTGWSLPMTVEFTGEELINYVTYFKIIGAHEGTFNGIMNITSSGGGASHAVQFINGEALLIRTNDANNSNNVTIAPDDAFTYFTSLPDGAQYVAIDIGNFVEVMLSNTVNITTSPDSAFSGVLRFTNNESGEILDVTITSGTGSGIFIGNGSLYWDVEILSGSGGTLTETNPVLINNANLIISITR